MALSSLLAAASAGNLGHAVSSQSIVRYDEGHHGPLAPYNAPVHYVTPLEHVAPIAYGAPINYDDGHYDGGHYEHVSN